jgi:hypothetical protein
VIGQLLGHLGPEVEISRAQNSSNKELNMNNFISDAPFLGG